MRYVRMKKLLAAMEAFHGVVNVQSTIIGLSDA
jgi:hypothetical protein